MSLLLSDSPRMREGFQPRDYQQEAVESSIALYEKGERGVLIRVFTGGGKCFGLGTPVLMFDGSIKPIESIVAGDVVMGPDSTPKTVASVASGIDVLYRITPKKGDSIVVTRDHILCLKATKFNSRTAYGLRSGQEFTIRLDDYINRTRSFKHIAKGYRKAVDFPARDVPLDPYFLGCWLADGSWSDMRRVHITTMDDEVVQSCKDVASSFGLSFIPKQWRGRARTYGLSRRRGQKDNALLTILRRIVGPTKNVPHLYKANERSVRLEILAGILDGDGYMHHNGFDFVSISKILVDDVAFLCRSLGLAAYVKPCRKTCTNTGAVGDYWRCGISGDISIIPNRIPRRQGTAREQKKDPLVFGFDVERVGIGDYYGFSIVETDKRFLLGDLTVAHNSAISCMLMEHWLSQHDNNRCLVLSYERQLVYQFAEEIEDWLSVRPGIEMAGEGVDENNVPLITVASRQSLMVHRPPTKQQLEELDTFGFSDVGVLPRHKAKSMLRRLREDGDEWSIRQELERLQESKHVNVENGLYSRLYKFDWRHNWLVIMDEGHKYIAQLMTVGPLIDWFDKNPNSWRAGCSATPLRSDGVSIGDTMFPAVAIDFPLRSFRGRGGVEAGWAVPYIQKFICVENVDFSQLSKKGKDFDLDQIESLLGSEEEIAKLVQPVLDLAGDRKTLIFSATVNMAKNVAAFINARVPCECSCGTKAWFARRLIGDGAKCEDCGEWITIDQILDHGFLAESLDGGVPHNDRKEVYRRYAAGEFRFLSICGLCREGFNERAISCVAVLRPVSKDAASLAEQMKGRGCRPLPGVVEGLASDEERREAIANSDKDSALIIDLVGVSGLPDCASTASIYSEGLPDEVVDIATKLMLDGEEDVAEAIDEAMKEIEERERIREEKIRLIREAEERRYQEAVERAKLGAKVNYHITDISDYSAGVAAASKKLTSNPLATDKQLGYIWHLGLKNIDDYMRPTKKQAGRIITQLKSGKTPSDVIYKSGLKPKIDGYTTMIDKATDNQTLDEVGRAMLAEKKDRRINSLTYRQLVDLGKQRRQQINQ